MSELDRPGGADIGAREFEAMVDAWPDRVTVRRLLQRAGSSDAVTIVSEEYLPRPRPSFTPAADIRKTDSLPVLQ